MEHFGRKPYLLVGEMYARPGGQIGPDFPTRGIKADTRELTRPIASGNGKSPSVPTDEVGQAGVADLYSLRVPG